MMLTRNCNPPKKKLINDLLNLEWSTYPDEIDSINHSSKSNKEVDGLSRAWIHQRASQVAFQVSKEPTFQWRRHKRHSFNPWVGKIPWRRVWQPTPVFSPGESHGQKSLEGYSPWGHKESERHTQTKHMNLCTQSSQYSRETITSILQMKKHIEKTQK